MRISERFEQILIYAQKHHVSDIHFHVKEKEVSIRMRTPFQMIDYPADEMDMTLLNELAYRAQIDLTDKIRPQTGAFTFDFYKRKMYFRLAMMYSLDNLSLVLRILYQKVVRKKLSTDADQNAFFDQLRKKEDGLILFSGPTGSGKTTSAYGLIEGIRNKQIYTIEDPIELPLSNAIQLQVNPKQNITYDTGIKQLLRHDPDVILIGEIRDEVEAHMAIRAALTGHLVISTIHARSCIGAIVRLLDLGVSRFDLFETLLCVTNQRLIGINEKERVCLYEIMDEKDLGVYQKTGQLPEDFRTIQKQKEALFKEESSGPVSDV